MIKSFRYTISFLEKSLMCVHSLEVACYGSMQELKGPVTEIKRLSRRALVHKFLWSSQNYGLKCYVSMQEPA